MAHPLLARDPGVPLRACGAQGLIDRTAEDLRPWQAEREPRAAAAVGAAEATAPEWRVAIALEGGSAYRDGRWPPPTVATLQVRRLEAPAAAPPLGTGLARRYGGVLGAAEELAARVHQALQEAGWRRIPSGEMRGDGAPWIWKGADAAVPGGRQTRDDSQLSEPLDALAHRRYPHHPAGATAWVDLQLGALLPARVGEVRRALKRLRPWKQAIGDGLATWMGDVEHHRPRIRDPASWHRGLAVGSGAVEGACKHVLHSRFTRAGMRWQQAGLLNVLAWRLARLNGTCAACWARRRLKVHASVAPTQ